MRDNIQEYFPPYLFRLTALAIVLLHTPVILADSSGEPARIYVGCRFPNFQCHAKIFLSLEISPEDQEAITHRFNSFGNKPIDLDMEKSTNGSMTLHVVSLYPEGASLSWWFGRIVPTSFTYSWKYEVRGDRLFLSSFVPEVDRQEGDMLVSATVEPEKDDYATEIVLIYQLTTKSTSPELGAGIEGLSIKQPADTKEGLYRRILRLQFNLVKSSSSRHFIYNEYSKSEYDFDCAKFRQNESRHKREQKLKR